MFLLGYRLPIINYSPIIKILTLQSSIKINEIKSFYFKLRLSKTTCLTNKGKIFAWQGQLPLDLPPPSAPTSGSCHRYVRLPHAPATSMCACHTHQPPLCAPATRTSHQYVRLPHAPATAMCACHTHQPPIVTLVYTVIFCVCKNVSREI